MSLLAPSPEAEPVQSNGLPALSRCLNCGTELQGLYCHVCGQEGVDKNVSMGQLLSDVLGDLFAFDGRFVRTIVPLFTQPGALTVAFNRGHRAPYVPPVRMYVFSSFLFFLVVAALSFDTTSLFMQSGDGRLPGAVADTTAARTTDSGEMTDAERAEMEAGMDSLRTALFGEADAESASDSSSNYVRIAGRDASDSWIGRLIQERGRRISEDPGAFRAHLASRIPLLLFLLVPVFAAELKLLYVRRKRLFVQHLVFALHVHAFAFLTAALLIVLQSLWSPFGVGYLLIPVYLFLAMRRTYEQSRGKTFVKELGLWFLHFWSATIAMTIYVLLQLLFF